MKVYVVVCFALSLGGWDDFAEAVKDPFNSELGGESWLVDI
jgi:hypothetical protein